MRELLKRHEDLASARPDDHAVEYHDGRSAGTVLTWAGLCERAERIRTDLLDAGARRHCVSALVLNDHPDLVPTLLALWQLDSPPVLLDPQWGGGLTASVLAHSTPVFRVDLEPAVTVTPLAAGAGSTDVPSDAVFIGYTSGSTGDPKAIVFTHERLYDGTLGNVSASLRLRAAPAGPAGPVHADVGIRCHQPPPHLGRRARRLRGGPSGADRRDGPGVLVPAGGAPHRPDLPRPPTGRAGQPVRAGPGHHRARPALLHRQCPALAPDPGAVPAPLRTAAAQRLRALRDLVGRLLRRPRRRRHGDQPDRGARAGRRPAAGLGRADRRGPGRG